MANPKRQCATCHFFQQTTMKGYGWCNHPQKKQASGVRILVRERELACRDSWGVDFWTDKESRATTSQAPTTPEADFQFVNQNQDDEVTGIVDTSERLAAANESANEDRVTHTSIRDDRDIGSRHIVNDANAAANRDQEDRVGAMAKGPRLALEQAWSRNKQRQSPEPEQDSSESGDARGNTPSATRSEDDIRHRPVHGSGNTPPVPREEVRANRERLSPAIGPDARFDSVPDIKIDVELPLLRKRKFARPGTSADAPSEESGYDKALRRARKYQQERSTDIDADKPAELPSTPDPERYPEPPIAEAHGRVPAIVWDVEPGGLDQLFSRTAGEAAPLQDLEDVGFLDGNGPAGTTRIGMRANDDDAYPDARDSRHQGVRHHGSRENLAQESKHSWWRGRLGLRKRRRATPEPDMYQTSSSYESYDSVDSEAAWSTYLDDDPSEQPLDLDDDIGRQDDAWLDPPARHDDAVAASGSADPTEADREYLLATSEESWRHDERAFPVSQPVAWRDSPRQAIRGNGWRDLPEVAPAPVPRAEAPRLQDFPEPASAPVPRAGTPRLQDLPELVPELVSHAGKSHRQDLPGQQLERPPERDSMRYFLIDEPGGMREFRSALFGSDGTDPDDSPGARHPVPRANDRNSSARERPRTGDGVRNTGWKHESGTRASQREPAFDIWEAVPDREEDIRPQFEVASRVEKCCRTCRSFRATEQGDRGWCANDHAFTHRQMVGADELPCRSTIGDWWLAADQAWAPPQRDVTQDTPRTDVLLARRDSLDEPNLRNDRRVRTRKAV